MSSVPVTVAKVDESFWTKVVDVVSIFSPINVKTTCLRPRRTPRLQPISNRLGDGTPGTLRWNHVQTERR